MVYQWRAHDLSHRPACLRGCQKPPTAVADDTVDVPIHRSMDDTYCRPELIHALADTVVAGQSKGRRDKLVCDKQSDVVAVQRSRSL